MNFDLVYWTIDCLRRKAFKSFSALPQIRIFFLPVTLFLVKYILALSVINLSLTDYSGKAAIQLLTHANP